MIDLRPVAFVIGLLVTAMGVMMLLPMALDWQRGDPNWRAFLAAAMVTGLAGATMAFASASGRGTGLTLRQGFVVTAGVWIVLPLAGAVPFVLGAPGAGLTDAYFEAVSGMTTTGTTVFAGLDALPRGTNLWRGMLNWLGGLGIVIVAMVFLPTMKVGGMQFFRSEGFDTLGKVLPRALDISVALIGIYLALTVACVVTYYSLGLPGFEAVVHALSTVSTGGFSSTDRSFAAFVGAPEVAATIFMIAASLPFIRYVQLARGSVTPLWHDAQVRAYLRWIALAVGAVTLHEVLASGAEPLPMLRQAAFNIVSSFSGAGFTSADLTLWQPFSFVILIVVGLIGGCTSSTACSIKVFRFLVLFEAIRVQIRRLHSPNAMLKPRYEDRTLEPDVIDSVIVFFTLFMASFGILTAALSMTGLDSTAAVTAAWTSIANVGPVFGTGVGASGSVGAFPWTAKWLMIGGMLVGRLEMLAFFVLFLPRFWRP